MDRHSSIKGFGSVKPHSTATAALKDLYDCIEAVDIEEYCVSVFLAGCYPKAELWEPFHFQYTSTVCVPMCQMQFFIDIQMIPLFIGV